MAQVRPAFAKVPPGNASGHARAATVAWLVEEHLRERRRRAAAEIYAEVDHNKARDIMGEVG